MNRVRYDDGPWIRLKNVPLPKCVPYYCPICGVKCEVRYYNVILCPKRHPETKVRLQKKFQEMKKIGWPWLDTAAD